MGFFLFFRSVPTANSDRSKHIDLPLILLMRIYATATIEAQWSLATVPRVT